MEKETHLHLTCKELDKFKKQLKSVENTKLQALRELEKANRTLQELTNKLETVSESKQAALEATEVAKARAKQLEESKSTQPQLYGAGWKQDVDSEIEQYKASTAELNFAKQELTNLRQDFDSALEAKLAAFQEAADAKHGAKVNREKLTGLSKEIGTMRSTLNQVKLASVQAQEGHSKLMAEKEARLQSKRNAKEGVEKKICSLKEEFDDDPELAGKLEEMLEETNEAIGVLQEQLKAVRDSDLDSLRIATSEINDARKTLEQVLEEKISLQSLVEYLKMELEKVKRDKKELLEKESETALLSERLHIELVKSKEEREVARAGENKGEGMRLKLQELSLEAVNATKEAEELKRKAEALKQEAETFRKIAKEAGEKLQIAMKEAEEAKAREEHANAQIQNSTTRGTNNEVKSSGSKGKIKLSAEEFEALTGKAERAGNSADIEVESAMAQVDAITERENEVSQRLEAVLKEIEDIKAATQDSLKKADMAEAAKQAVESELSKWRQKEHKKNNHQVG